MFDAAKPFTPITTYRLSLWTLWINPVTYPLRLGMVWVGMKTLGMSTADPKSGATAPPNPVTPDNLVNPKKEEQPI